MNGHEYNYVSVTKTKALIKKYGGPTRVARLCKIHPSSVWRWANGKGMPGKWLRFIERARPLA